MRQTLGATPLLLEGALLAMMIVLLFASCCALVPKAFGRVHWLCRGGSAGSHSCKMKGNAHCTSCSAVVAHVLLRNRKVCERSVKTAGPPHCTWQLGQAG
jgi:hypothetical protein